MNASNSSPAGAWNSPGCPATPTTDNTLTIGDAARAEHVDHRPVEPAAPEPLADHDGHVMEVGRQAVVEVDHARVDPPGEVLGGGGRAGQLDGHRRDIEGDDVVAEAGEPRRLGARPARDVDRGAAGRQQRQEFVGAVEDVGRPR